MSTWIAVAAWGLETGRVGGCVQPNNGEQDRLGSKPRGKRARDTRVPRRRGAHRGSPSPGGALPALPSQVSDGGGGRPRLQVGS